MSKGKKLWIICGGVALLAIIVVASINSSRRERVAVQTAIVQRKDVLTSKVTASGEIRAKQFVDLQPEISGIITELYVHEGDSVKKGDALLRIDPIQTDADTRIARAQYDQAVAEARAQEFEIANAEVNLARDETSLVSARAELQQAENNFLTMVRGSADERVELIADISQETTSEVLQFLTLTAGAAHAMQLPPEQFLPSFRELLSH